MTQQSSKSARQVLLFLTLINLFNYLDRYILVALSPAIKRDLQLSDTQIGFLTTAFMFSYFLVSPLFGWLGDRNPRLKLMSLGVAVWSAATVACGWGRSAAHLLGARLFVGVGEAAYGSISPSLIRDLFPKEICGRMFAIFFMAIPVGSALGFLLGGVLEKTVGWRAAFFVAGVPGLLLALGLLFLTEPKRGAFDGHEGSKDAPAKVPEVLRALWGNPSYVLTVLGYCAYTFVVGGVAVWIPHYIERYLGQTAADGNMAFGAITVVAGFLGTIVGGSWADRWALRSNDAYLKLSALSMLAAFPVYILVMTRPEHISFYAATFALEFLLFLSTSPVNAEIVNCVSPRIRANANAISIFAIHLLGDAISPPLVGRISELSDLRTGMWIFLIAILFSALIWGWKVIGRWGVMSWPEGALKLPLSQCHRGFHDFGVQENTIAAFRAAAKAGAPMVELDVRLSRDGQAVVVHDADISRVAGGKQGTVAKLSAAELKALANVPSLREVLEDTECRSLLVNVELKHLPARTGSLARAVELAVRGANAENRVLFSSFNPLALRAISRLLPNVPRALLATGEPDPENKFYLRRMYLAFLARPHMLNFDGRYFTAELALSLASRKVPVAIWTVEDPQEARKFLAMGAESIISPIPKIV